MVALSVSSAGSTFVSGGVSGLDTQSLIQNAVNAKLIPVKRLQDQVTTNTSKIAAFQKLQTLAETFKTSLDKLRSTATNTGLFAQKQASFTSSNPSVSAASVLTATLGTNAQAGTHEVVVNSTAKSFAAQGTNQTSITTALGLTGSFDIGEAGKTATTINITSSTTIQDIRDAINASTTTTGVKADILQVSPGNYRLVIRGADTNKEVSVTNITGDNALNTLGVVSAGGAFADITQQQQPASITINNTTVTSDTNVFTEVLSGVTLNVLNAAPGTTINLTIGDNTDGIKAAIQDLVTSFNALRANIAANKLVGADGTVDANAFLYNESLNTSLGQSISDLVTRGYGTSGSYNGLRSLGITLTTTGDLAIDATTLDTALKSNFNDVKAVFASSTSPASTGFADSAYTLINAFSNTATGTIASIITSLQSDNTSLTSRATDIQNQVDAYQLTLIDKYAKMEVAIKNATTLKAQILAILKGSSSSD